MDGVKVTLGTRGMVVEAARQFVKDRKEWRALVYIYIYMNEHHSAIFDWFLCFSIPLSLDLVADHLERSGMPLHDAVVVNCKNGCVSCNY